MNIIILTRLSNNMKMAELVPIVFAFMLKKKYGATITIITMSVKCSPDTLEELKDNGIDKIIFLSDSVFVGSDTYATATVLSEAIKKLNIDFDLILCSEMSSFGETGFVPVMTAELLGIDYELSVDNIEYFQENRTLHTESKLRNGIIVKKLSLPCLLAINSFKSEKFFKENKPNLFDIMKFKDDISVSVIDSSYLEILPQMCGIEGSTTKVISSSDLRSVIKNYDKEIITDESIAAQLLDVCMR